LAISSFGVLILAAEAEKVAVRFCVVDHIGSKRLAGRAQQ